MAFACLPITVNATEATNCPLTNCTVCQYASKTAKNATRVASGRTHALVSQATNHSTRIRIFARRNARKLARMATARLQTLAPAIQDTDRITTHAIANRFAASPARMGLAWRRKCATATQVTSYWRVPNTFASLLARTLA